jgi:hypothetical protein
VARRTRTLTAGIAVLLIAAFLSACDVPPPFETSVHSPGAESARAAGVRSAADGTPIAQKTGITGGSSILWASDAERTRLLDAIAATGARWFTLDIDWNSIQAGGATSFWWDATDRLVIQARARGLRLIGIVAYTPTWARPADCPPGTNKCLPASPEYFANFARALADRYGTLSTNATFRNSITVWQVWNEPNHYPFVQPTVDAAKYTNLLKRAYVSFKAGDPASTVLAGGTAPAPDDTYTHRDMAPLTFLRKIYQYGGQGFFDAFAHHPYSFPCNPIRDAASWNAFTQTKYLRDLMVQNGDGTKRIWGTESGAPTGQNTGPCVSGPNVSVTEAQQAQWVADYFTGWHQDWGAWTGPLIWYQIRDNGTNPTFFEDHMGLLRRDYSEKPAYRTFKQLILGG